MIYSFLMVILSRWKENSQANKVVFSFSSFSFFFFLQFPFFSIFSFFLFNLSLSSSIKMFSQLMKRVAHLMARRGRTLSEYLVFPALYTSVLLLFRRVKAQSNHVSSILGFSFFFFLFSFFFFLFSFFFFLFFFEYFNLNSFSIFIFI